MNPLPNRAGLGLKAEHYEAVLERAPEGFWCEVHPENYMLAGGPRLTWLEAIRAKHPLSFHGVGLSLCGPDRPDPAHLGDLKRLVDRFEPDQVSEHAAWSVAGGAYHADLFPAPPSEAVLDIFVRNIDIVQSALARPILIENPSVYLPLKGEMSIAAFCVEAAKRSGCGLLLDINNVYVSARNTGERAEDYLDATPPDQVGEIHLAGHEVRDEEGDQVLIDSHGAAICDPVWALYETWLDRHGAFPTLVERDENIPSFDELLTERDRADAYLMRARDQAAASVAEPARV